MTPTRIVRFIGIVGLIGWFGMVGWVAKTTQAQNGGAVPPPVAPVGDIKDAPPPSVDAQPSKLKSPAPPIQTDEKRTGPAPSANATKPFESAPSPYGLDETLPPAPKDSLRPIASTSTTTAATPPDDPEQSAQAFMERSRKEAEAHLKDLSTEAAQLRARLAKLESGIKRWQSLVNALKGTQASSMAEEASPSDLESLPQASIGDHRADKRVKWASSNPTAPAEDALDSPLPGPAPARAPAPAPYARPAAAVAPGLVPR